MSDKRFKASGRLWAGVALAALLGSGGARAESLGDALVSAYKSSNLLEQNEAVLRAADEDLATAVSTLRPVISWILESQYTDNMFGENTTNVLRLNIDWEVYGFGRRNLDIAVAEEVVLATRQALRAVEQSILLDAVSAYMDLRRARETVAINENSVRVIGEELKAAQDRFEVGEVTRTDVAIAEARLASARAALAAAQGDADIARAAYQAAIGHQPDGRTALPATPALPKSLEEAQAIAQRLHPLILQAQHSAKAADLRVERAAAERRPSLGANLRLQEDEFGEDASSATLQLSQTIYAGGRLSAEHRKAIAGRDSARSALLQQSVDIAEQVARAWSGIEVSRAQIGAIERQIEAATAAYEGVKEEASLGARTTLDVLDAERDVLEARSNRASAEADLQVAIYSLLASMGLLTAENLKLGIPVYDPEAYYNAVRNAPPTSAQGKSLDRVLQAIGKN